MDERTLIGQAVSGDKQAFAALYTRYRDSLYRYAYFRLGSETDAEDAVSSCVVEAYSQIRSLKYEKAFRAWIFRILYRCCCKLIKEQSASAARADVSELDNVPAPDGDRLSPELSEAFDMLGGEDREIVLLSVIAGYNSREIGALTSLKPATVRSRLARALSKMRTYLTVTE